MGRLVGILRTSPQFTRSMPSRTAGSTCCACIIFNRHVLPSFDAEDQQAQQVLPATRTTHHKHTHTWRRSLRRARSDARLQERLLQEQLRQRLQNRARREREWQQQQQRYTSDNHQPRRTSSLGRLRELHQHQERHINRLSDFFDSINTPDSGRQAGREAAREALQSGDRPHQHQRPPLHPSFEPFESTIPLLRRHRTSRASSPPTRTSSASTSGISSPSSMTSS